MGVVDVAGAVALVEIAADGRRGDHDDERREAQADAFGAGE